jgi:hypothetical protein
VAPPAGGARRSGGIGVDVGPIVVQMIFRDHALHFTKATAADVAMLMFSPSPARQAQRGQSIVHPDFGTLTAAAGLITVVTVSAARSLRPGPAAVSAEILRSAR